MIHRTPTPAHLIYSHGYERSYAERLSPEKRKAEHDRLHEDDTAAHLDHEHIEVVRERERP